MNSDPTPEPASVDRLPAIYRRRRLICGLPDTSDLLGDRESAAAFVKAQNRMIDEFVSSFPDLRLRAMQLPSEIQAGNHLAVESFARDFYDGYHLSSGELTNCVGAALVLECFRLLVPYFELVTEEWEEFQALPEELVIYRGGHPPLESLVCGYSWTLWKDCARGYGNAPGDLIIRAQIKKSQVLAFFCDMQECVLDPACLSSSVEVDEVTA